MDEFLAYCLPGEGPARSAGVSPAGDRQIAIFRIFFQIFQNLFQDFLCQNIDVLTLFKGFWHEFRWETTFKSPQNYRGMNRRILEKSEFFMCGDHTEWLFFGFGFLEIWSNFDTFEQIQRLIKKLYDLERKIVTLECHMTCQLSPEFFMDL